MTEILLLGRGKGALFILCLTILLMSGCAGNVVYPVASGFHAPIDSNKQKLKRAVVWSNHPGIGNAAIAWLQQAGITVVERARLNQIFDEQKIRLTHTPDDDAAVLRVGKLIGADRVIFMEATSTSAVSSFAYISAYGGASRSDMVYHLNVAVRGVDVETGEVRWSGEAHFPQPINNPEAGLVELARVAIARALCPVEAGYEWHDPSRWDRGGCNKMH